VNAHPFPGEEEATELPSDVSRSQFAVYMGERRRRFVVPIALLDRPEFRSLLRRAEEEFGFAGAGAGGALVLPCEEVAFPLPHLRARLHPVNAHPFPAAACLGFACPAPGPRPPRRCLFVWFIGSARAPYLRCQWPV
jgi:hypothetical protein